MLLRENSTRRVLSLHKAVILVLAGAVFLGNVPGIRAEGESAPTANSGGTPESGGAAPSPLLRPGFNENVAPVTPESQSAEAPASPAPVPDSKPEPSTVLPFTSDLYNAPIPSTSVGSLGSSINSDGAQPIVVPRSGGLPTVEFTNKTPNWLKASLGIAETYDNNVLLRSNKQEDFITRISPILGFNFQNQLLDWNLGSSLDYRYYVRDTRTEDFSYALNTNGKITVLRDYAYILISDQYSQTSRSNATNYSSLSSNVNVTDLNVLKANPRLELPITARLKFNPQYSYTNYWYPSKSVQNRQSNQVAADLSYDLSSGLTPYAGYSYTRMTGNGTVATYNQSNYKQSYPYIGLRYQDERFTLTGTAGYSSVDPDRGESTNAPIWNVSLVYRLSTMSFTFATSSDVDQSAYLSDTSLSLRNDAPQMVTSYSGNFVKQFRNLLLSLSLYFRENDNIRTSELLSRNFGTSGAVRQDFGPRFSGSFDYRVERNDQLSYLQQNTNQSTHRIIYELGYNLTYTFGKDWNVTGSYIYQNSSSPKTLEYAFVYSTYNYTDNRLMLGLRKEF